MQVFDIYTYNLKHLKFKENKGFFDSVLSEYGFKYKDIGFCFTSDLEGQLCDKTIGLFPTLAPYKRFVAANVSVPEYHMSSISVGENGEISLHIDKAHINDFSLLLKKIPYSVNFNFMGVILDNIDWNNMEISPGFEPDAAKRIIGDHCFTNYYSNSIRFIKEFDYGNKLNRVDVLIERAWNAEKLLPCDTNFYAFCSLLGKSVSQKTVCIFNDEEREKLRAADERMLEQIVRFKHSSPGIVCDEIYAASGAFSLLKGFSPKRFTGIAEKYGFKYAKCENGKYRYKKTNMYRHTFEVSFYMKPSSCLIFSGIRVYGYNFSFCIFDFPEMVADREETSKSCAEKVFEIACDAEKNLTEELYSCYGKTPDWYEG